MDTVWTDETIAQRQSKFRWMFEEPFWLALITGNYAEYGKEDIEKEARRKNIHFFPCRKMVPALMVSYPFRGEEEESGPVAAPSLKSMYWEFLPEIPEMMLPVELSAGQYVILFDSEDAAKCAEKAGEYFSALKKGLRKTYRYHLEWQFGSVCTYQSLPAQCRELYKKAAFAYDAGSPGSCRFAVRQVMDYLCENPSADCEELAGRVFLHPDYLTKLFKKETGMTLIEYATEVRLDAAKELLEHTSLYVGEIANRLSYRNFSYFSKLFKQKTGVTPKQYRQGKR